LAQDGPRSVGEIKVEFVLEALAILHCNLEINSSEFAVSNKPTARVFSERDHRELEKVGVPLILHLSCHTGFRFGLRHGNTKSDKEMLTWSMIQRRD
jgi:hypothetical protein